jgi:hypothetical protein
VRDFGPHKDTDLSLSTVNVLLGPNEAGKTMLVDALVALKTGTARGLDVKENKEMVRDGCDGWTIEAVVDGKDVRRTRSGLTTEAEFPGDARVLRALLDAPRFLKDLKPGERRELVASLTARPTAEIVSKLVEHGAVGDIVEAVQSGNLRRAARLATEERREADRRLERAKQDSAAAPIDVEVQTSKGPKPISTIALLGAEQVLTRCRQALEATIRAAGAGSALDHARADIEEAKAALAKVEVLPWTADDEKAVADLERQRNGSRELAATALATSNEKSHEAGALKAILGAEDPCCPLCRTALVKESGAAAKKALDALQARAKEARESYTRESKAADDADGKALVLRKKKRARDEQEAEVLAPLRRRAEAVLPEARAAGDAPAMTEEQAKADVERVRKIVDARRAYDAAAAAQKTAADTLAGYESKVADAKAVEAACAPDVIEDEAAVRDRLAGPLKVAVASLFGDTEAVTLTPGWDIRIRGRRAELASDSLQLRAGLALALALAQLSGLKLVVLDRFEAVVGQERTKVLRLLKALVADGAIDTAILCCATDKREPGPKADWLAWFWIENGSASPL